MANGFVYFQSTDVGAPTLNGQQGALLNVLDWVIDLPSAPYKWTVEFTGTNKKVYRPPEGDRLYFRVDDGLATTGTTSAPTCRNATIRMYDTMSDVDTGTFQVPTATQIAALTNEYQLNCIPKSELISTAARPYEGIITSRWMWLVTYADNAAPNDAFFTFFGDLAGWNGGTDDYLTVLMTHMGTTLTTTGGNMWLRDSTEVQNGLFPSSASSNATTVAKAFCRATADGATRSTRTPPCTWGLWINAKSSGTLGRSFSLPLVVTDRISTTHTVGTNAYPRGIMPNIRILTFQPTTGDTFTEGSREFKCIRVRGNTPTGLALEITNTDPNYDGF